MTSAEYAVAHPAHRCGREAREDCGLTAEELAAYLGVPATLVTAWEAGAVAWPGGLAGAVYDDLARAAEELARDIGMTGRR